METAMDAKAEQCLDALGIVHERDVPLGPMTWYQVGGWAQVLAHPQDESQLSRLMRACDGSGVEVRVLGRGANLLVRDTAVPGVVVKLDGADFAKVTVQDDCLTAGAGCDLFKLVQDAARQGLAGLEVLAGIPGTVGGAIRMNAGGAFGDIGSVTAQVRVMSHAGEIQTLTREAVGFAYRHTAIDGRLVLDATFALKRESRDTVKARVKEIFAYKKNSQPMGDDSAGCAFKNPPKQLGVTAGQLIDQAGLKGFTIGQAKVSTVHANFVITEKGAAGRADDIFAVIEHVQKTVYEKFGVRLEREVVVWP